MFVEKFAKDQERRKLGFQLLFLQIVEAIPSDFGLGLGPWLCLPFVGILIRFMFFRIVFLGAM